MNLFQVHRRSKIRRVMGGCVSVQKVSEEPCFGEVLCDCKMRKDEKEIHHQNKLFDLSDSVLNSVFDEHDQMLKSHGPFISMPQQVNADSFSNDALKRSLDVAKQLVIVLENVVEIRRSQV